MTLTNQDGFACAFWNKARLRGEASLSYARISAIFLTSSINFIDPFVFFLVFFS